MNAARVGVSMTPRRRSGCARTRRIRPAPSRGRGGRFTVGAWRRPDGDALPAGYGAPDGDDGQPLPVPPEAHTPGLYIVALP